MRKVFLTNVSNYQIVTKQIGIDAQAELQLKGESSVGGSVNTRLVTTSVATVQRAIMNRHQQARRQPPGVAAKLDTRNRVAQVTSSAQSPNPSSQSQAASSSSHFDTLPAIGNQHVVPPPPYSPETQHLEHMRLQQATTASMARQPGQLLDHDSVDETTGSTYETMSGYNMSSGNDLNQPPYQSFMGEHNMNDLLGKLTRLLSPTLYTRAMFVLD